MSDAFPETDRLPENATPLPGMEIVCQDCGKERTNEPNYSPIQPIMGKPLGWYSGDKDGELCPDCIAKLMNLGNATSRYRGWKDGD